MVLLILEYFTQNVNSESQNIAQFLKQGGENLLYNNVKKLCDEKNVAISQMERDLSFPRSSICKWNDNTPSVTKVKKVADYLEVQIERLLAEDTTEST